MRADELDYDLPAEFIAQQPAERREMSKLLVLNRSSGVIEHRLFRDITEYLRPGDLLVLNNTRVLPCKLIGRRETGGKVDALLVRQTGPRRWAALMRSTRHLHAGEPVNFEDGAVRTVYLGRCNDKLAIFEFEAEDVLELLRKAARAPLPPYIKRDPWHYNLRRFDLERYQTVYAEKPGAIAAPTAGLHFTAELLEQIRDIGVETLYLTLHVGPGTFRPVKTELLGQHSVDPEYYEVEPAVWKQIAEAHGSGRRVIAVGTTSCRVIETLIRTEKPELSGWTDLFIYPPFEFLCIDALITNFHLPRSSLLALACAFAGPGGLAGRESIFAAYEQAKQRRYRFYSYGDAMFIHAARLQASGRRTEPQP